MQAIHPKYRERTAFSTSVQCCSIACIYFGVTLTRFSKSYYLERISLCIQEYKWMDVPSCKRVQKLTCIGMYPKCNETEFRVVAVDTDVSAKSFFVFRNSYCAILQYPFRICYQHRTPIRPSKVNCIYLESINIVI